MTASCPENISDELRKVSEEVEAEYLSKVKFVRSTEGDVRYFGPSAEGITLFRGLDSWPDDYNIRHIIDEAIDSFHIDPQDVDPRRQGDSEY